MRIEVLVIFASLLLGGQIALAEGEVVFEKSIRLPNLETQTLPGDAPGTVQMIANLKDKNLGRAWVRIQYPSAEMRDDSGPSYETIRVQLPGLASFADRRDILRLATPNWLYSPEKLLVIR